MSTGIRNVPSKSKKRVLKEDKNKTFFTKNNLRFGSRKIPTLEEMIVERNYNLQSRHCSLSDLEMGKLDTSLTQIIPQDFDANHVLENGTEKSCHAGQISPSTVSFATLYKGTSTLKSNLLIKTVKNPYHKYINEQKRLAEKCQNIEEEQLERLEKETEEDIILISEKFCEKVKSWDEEDNTVAEALQSLTPVKTVSGNTGDTSVMTNAPTDTMQGITKEKFKHLMDPTWISDLFRICFGAPWLDGFSKTMKETKATTAMCVELGIPVKEMRRQRIKIERVQAEKILCKEAAKPRVAFGCTVPRAKGLDDLHPQSRMHSTKKALDDPMDLVTMRAVWGNQLNSRSTRHYCKHLRELIKEKMEGSIDADSSLAAVTLSQMKPKVFLDAGILTADDLETSSVSSSISSQSTSLESSSSLLLTEEFNLDPLQS